MKCEVLQVETLDGDVAYILPHSVSYMSFDHDKDCLVLHMSNGDCLNYRGEFEDFCNWLKKSSKIYIA